jgi:uncharacterized protein YfaS (alpha-2-macroglobulin family)
VAIASPAKLKWVVLASLLAVVSLVGVGHGSGQVLGRPAPPRIVDYGPTGRVAQSLTQLKVRFSRPMGFFEDGRDLMSSDLLAISPKVEGRLYWMAPDLLVFESEAPFPEATAFEVRLPPNFTSVDGAKVESPPTWRFETPRPSCDPMALPSEKRGALGGGDAIGLTCNQEVFGTLGSSISVSANGRSLPVKIVTRKGQERSLWVEPVESWPAGAELSLAIRPGLHSKSGPLTSDSELHKTFAVAPLPAVVDVSCSEQLTVRFATPLADQAWKKIVIEPTLRFEWDRPNWVVDKPKDGERPLWRAHLPLPTPGTKYTITVPAGSVDIYGRKLAAEWRREVLCPMPEDVPTVLLGRPNEPLLGVFEPAKPRTTILQTKALKSVQLDYAPMDPAAMTPNAIRGLMAWAQPKSLFTGDDDVDEADHPKSPPLFVPKFSVSRPISIIVEPEQFLDRTILDLSDIPKGRLVAARVLGQAKGEAPEAHGVVQVSDLGLAGWLTHGRGVVQALHVSTGQAWPGVSIRVGKGDGPWLASGSSDHAGLRMVTAPFTEVEAIHATAPNGADGLVTITEPAFVMDGFPYPPYEEDRDETPKTPRETLLGELVLDRSLFARGETIRFTGYVGLGRPDGRVTPPRAGSTMQVRLGDKDSRAIEVAIDAHGKFWGQLPLPKDGPLGHGSLRARLVDATRPALPQDEESGEGFSADYEVRSFRIADIEVKAKISNLDVGPRDIPKLEVSANHLSGSSAELRSATVVRRCSVPSRQGRWETSKKQSTWWAFGPLGETSALPLTDRLFVDDRELATGHFTLDVPSLSLDPLRRTQCKIDVTIRDESLRSESAQVNYAVHPAAFALGLRAEQPTERKGLRVWLKAVDPQQNRVAVSGVLVQVRSQESNLLVKGTKVNLLGTGAPSEIAFDGLDEGRYRVSAEAYEGLHAVRTEVDGRVQEIWPRVKKKPVMPMKQRRLEDERPSITLPGTGRVGTMLTVVVRAPKQARSGLLGFLRGEVQHAVPLQFHGGLARVSVRVQDSWFPEVNVRAAVAIPGGRGQGQEVDPKATLVQADENLQIAPDHRSLKVTVQGPDKSGPNAEVSYRVAVRDHGGRVVPGARLSAWAVDEGLLTLVDYQIPNLIEAFAFRPEGTLVQVDSFEHLIEPFLEKELAEIGIGCGGSGCGGGGLGGRRASTPGINESVHVRSRFETTPFFASDIETDAQGEATLKFRLPDNLTRFRLTVVAAAPLEKDGPYVRFGNAETKIQVSQPLSLRPLLPKFLRPGDRSEASAVVLNQGTTAGQIEVALAQEGPATERPVIVLEGAAKRMVTLEPGREKRVSFAIRAKAEGRAQLLITARLGRGDRFQDAVRVPVEVVSEPAITDHIAMSGTLAAAAEAEIPVRLPETAKAGQGTWTLRLSRGFESDIEGALRYLAGYRYTCAEQTASTLLPMLLHPKHPLVLGPGDWETRVRARLARLEKMKVKSRDPEDEGGIAFWPGERRPDLFATAWALLVLSRAPQGVGAEVQLASLAKATARLVPQKTFGMFTSHAVQALGVLALAEAKQQVKDLPSPSTNYDPIVTGFLALALVDGAHDGGARESVLRTARGWLSEAILRLPEHARLLHVQPEARADGMPASGPEIGELALAWALTRIWPDHPALPKLARALAEHRRASQFASTFENALFLLVAADWSSHAQGQGSVEGLADDVQLLPSKVLPSAGQSFEHEWPFSALPTSFFDQMNGGRFILRSQGSNEVFYSMDASYPTMHPDEALDRGLTIETHLRGPNQARGDAHEVAAGEMLAFDIHLGVRSTQEHVAIDVPLPAGLEVINPDIAVEGLAVGRDAIVHRDLAGQHEELDSERVLIFPRFVRPGTIKHTVFVRALLAGDYQMPSPKAEVMYSPEIHGRGKATRFTVLPAASN